MTCLISWIGVDSRGQSSCYIASDSRFSWSDPQSGVVRQSWDCGRKIFCSRTTPDIWGYCGDVLIPSTLLGQLIEAIDEGIIAYRGDTWLQDTLSQQLDRLPAPHRRAFSIVHCSRSGESMESEFSMNHLQWKPDTGWESEVLKSQEKSALLGCYGGGRTNYLKWHARFDKSDVGRTSRAIFQAFTSMLREEGDPQVGGAPQLASLFRIGNGRQHGVIWEGQASVAGLRLTQHAINTKIVFRDHLFQLCDPMTMTILDGAQRQPLPKLIN